MVIVATGWSLGVGAGGFGLTASALPAPVKPKETAPMAATASAVASLGRIREISTVSSLCSRGWTVHPLGVTSKRPSS
jgi:hypothetical protein